jgi:hypothetical protein
MAGAGWLVTLTTTPEVPFPHGRCQRQAIHHHETQ